MSALIRLEIVLWERVDARLRERHDLPLSFFESLYFIAQAPDGSLRVGDLAKALRVTVGGTSKLVDRIESAGLIARQPDPDDRRAARVALTRDGERQLSAATKTYEQEVAAFADPVLSADEQREMHASITRLLDAAHRRSARVTATMRAAVLDAPGPPEALRIRELPIPTPRAGWVLIRVKAFGLNRSELHTRLGLAQGVTFPRVLGIEATGIVPSAPGGEFESGQQVAAIMGGMGRSFDGGYAEYTCVPAAQVIPFTSDLHWATLGAVPEMLQTAHGSLTVGLDAQPGQTLLIRGGTSSVGMATAILAKRRGLTVLSTTRRPERADALQAIGVDHPIIDRGEIAAAVRRIAPEGVDLALELVGTPTLPDTLRATKVHGVVCFTGMLSNQWTVPDFYPIAYLPHGVRLAAYGGDAADLPANVLQSFLDDVAAGRVKVPIDRTYTLDEITSAHADMEAGNATGKLVALT